MRSVDKGAHPVGDDGAAVPFKHYAAAAPYLMQRLGRYCSYCERTIPVNLAVAHKLPKGLPKYQHLEREWRNLLLACSNCNSAKGSQEFASGEALWPDEDDTQSLLAYAPSGVVKPQGGLPPQMTQRVRALLALLGLDRMPADMPNSDQRYYDRLEIWRKAEQAQEDLRQADSPALRRATVETARSSGGYSIWRTALQADADMQQRLSAAFPGTRPPPATPDLPK